MQKKLTSKRKKIDEYIVDENPNQSWTTYIWLWVTIEWENRKIFELSISIDSNILIAERFLSSVVKVYGKHPVSTDGGEGTWYPMAGRFLLLKHHLHFHFGQRREKID